MTRREETSVEAGAKLNHSLRLEEILLASVEAKLLGHAEEPAWTYSLAMNPALNQSFPLCIPGTIDCIPGGGARFVLVRLLQ